MRFHSGTIWNEWSKQNDSSFQGTAFQTVGVHTAQTGKGEKKRMGSAENMESRR